MLTITPGTAGRTIITVTATDAGGSNMSASQRFRVTVGNDYDTDGDGLIGVSNLAQLDAMRYDLDGNGYAGTVAAYAAAFPSPLDPNVQRRERFARDMNSSADLDFDTDGDGAVDSDDDYWNDGGGWVPIGWDSTYEYARFFNATFDGNGHTLSNLFTAGRAILGVVRQNRIGRRRRQPHVERRERDGHGGCRGAGRGEPRPSHRHPVVGASIWGASRRGTGRAQPEARLLLPQLGGGNGNESRHGLPAQASSLRSGRWPPPAAWSVTTRVSSSTATRQVRSPRTVQPAGWSVTTKVN